MSKIPGAGGRQRALYNAFDTKKFPNVIRTQSYLRLESSALSTQGQVTFPVLKSDSVPSVTEQRLALPDTFEVTDIGFYITKVLSGGSIGKSILYTFPNSTVFSKSGEAANFQEIYNGYYSVKINNRVYLEKTDMNRFYRVGGSQINVGLSTYDATNNANNKFLANTWDAPNYGLYPVTPTFTLSGAWKNEITITLPESVDLTGTSSSNYIVCICRGFLNQNHAAFNATGK